MIKKFSQKTINLDIISKYRGETYGVCILWIMLLHGVILDKVNGIPGLNWLFDILRHGNVGVDVFLFLSGMGVYFSFLRNNDIRSYAKKRVRRVVYPYLLIGGTYFVCWDLIKNCSVNAFLRDFSLFSFLFDGNKLVWYVFMICFCYVIFPYLFCIIYKNDGSYRKQGVLNGFLTIALVIGATFCLRYNYGDLYDNISIAVTRLPVFIFGVLCAKPIRDKRRISVWWLVLALLVVLSSFVVLKLDIFKGIFQRYYYCLWGMSLALVFSWLSSLIKFKWLHRVLVWFGSISYELYLCHILLRNLFRKSEYYTTHILWKYGALLVVSVVLAKLASVFLKNFDLSTKKEPAPRLKKRERIVWIDQMRGVVFYFVVLAHFVVFIDQFGDNFIDPNLIRTIIYSFHMPAFFFVSGLTFDHERITAQTVSSYAAKIAKRLLIPYLWLNFMLLPLWVITYKYLSNNEASLTRIIEGIFYANPMKCGTPSGALWFLPALFLALLLYQVVLKFAGGSRLKALPIIAALAWLSYMLRGIHTPWHVNIIPAAVVFVYAGNIFMSLYKSGKLKKLLKLSVLNVAAVIALAALGIFLSLKNDKISMVAGIYGANLDSIWFYYICAFIGTFVVLYVCEKLPKTKLLTFIGTNTLVMLAVHTPIIRVLVILYPNIMNKFWVIIALSFGIFAVMIPLSMLFNRCFPFVCGISPKGGKTKFVFKAFLMFWSLLVPVYAAGQCLLGIQLRSWYMKLVFVVGVAVLSAAGVFILNSAAPIAFLEKKASAKSE